jgi:hypothetical protein
VSSFVGEGELVIPMMMVIEEAVPAESRRRWIADRW